MSILKFTSLNIVLTGATVAAVALTASSAQAVTLNLVNGSLSLSGTGSVSGNTLIFDDIPQEGIGNIFLIKRTGSFLNFSGLGPVSDNNDRIDNLQLTGPIGTNANGDPLYKYASTSNPWINFGAVTYNSTPGLLSFYLNPGSNLVKDVNGASVVYMANPITGYFQFIDSSTNTAQSIGNVAVNFVVDPSNSSFNVTLSGSAVPEPLTMFGVGTALGFGSYFKRQVSKKQGKSLT